MAGGAAQGPYNDVLLVLRQEPLARPAYRPAPAAATAAYLRTVAALARGTAEGLKPRWQDLLTLDALGLTLALTLTLTCPLKRQLREFELV